MMMWIIVVLLFFVCLFLVYRLKRQQVEMSEYQRSDRLKSAFLKALAREIRTPLHSVSGLAEIISKADLYLSKSEKRNISDQMLYNARLIATLLDEVSIYSEDGSKGHQIEDERFSPNKLCQACIDAHFASVREGVRLTFVHSLGDEFFVSSDRHIIELVLNKMVFCACKFTRKGEIGVGCHYDVASHLLTFYVYDTGDGIPVERRDKLFSWFDNPDINAEETEFDLSVAQRLASKIGGYLRFDNTYTKGTRVEFTLPVR